MWLHLEIGPLGRKVKWEHNGAGEASPERLVSLQEIPDLTLSPICTFLLSPQAHRKAMLRHRKKATVHKPANKVSPGIELAVTSVWDFKPPELFENQFLLCKPNMVFCYGCACLLIQTGSVTCDLGSTFSSGDHHFFLLNVLYKWWWKHKINK